MTNETHLDHGLTTDQVSHVLSALNGGKTRVKVGALDGTFAIAEVRVPKSLGSVACALVGPATGTTVTGEVFFAKRGNRPNESRLVRQAPSRSRTVTAIVSGGILATAYGGPLAPQELGDPYLAEEGKAASAAFWATHALSAESFGL